MKAKQPDNKSESEIVLAAIKTLFRSRMEEELTKDVIKIARTIFQGENFEDIESNDSKLTPEIVTKTLKTFGIEYEIDITPKLMELDSIFNIEKSCILIGEAASGKTNLLELLCK